jgi:hypothetical protein
LVNPNYAHYIYENSDLAGSIEAPTVKKIDVEYTIGAETTARTVSCQFTYGGAEVTSPVCVMQYLATAATGQALATAPSDGTAAGTDGTILAVHTTNVLWTAISEADGDLDIVITESGEASFFLVTVLPSGLIKASAEIAFAS